MLSSIWAIVRGGRIVPLESVDIPEGTKVLVTLLPESETEFWLQASEVSLSAVWDNAEDGVYAELLKG